MSNVKNNVTESEEKIPIVGCVYTLEHLIEAPIEKLIIGKTRYTDDKFAFRCMCMRLQSIKDFLHCFYFVLRKKYDMWDQEEWENYAKEHNKSILDVINCETFQKMSELNPREFKKQIYDANKYPEYLIPLNINPDINFIKQKLWYI